MLPLIYTNAGAASIFLAACLVWNVPEVVGVLKQRAKISRKDAAVQDRGSLGILIGLQWSGLALNFLLAWLFQMAAISWHRTALFAVGILLILLGVALRWYSIWTLGATLLVTWQYLLVSRWCNMAHTALFVIRPIAVPS